MQTSSSQALAMAPPKAARDWAPYLFAAPLVVYLLMFQGYPLVQEFCRYRIEADEWAWDASGLNYMPEKIRAKVEVAGLDLAHLAY